MGNFKQHRRPANSGMIEGTAPPPTQLLAGIASTPQHARQSFWIKTRQVFPLALASTMLQPTCGGKGRSQESYQKKLDNKRSKYAQKPGVIPRGGYGSKILQKLTSLSARSAADHTATRNHLDASIKNDGVAVAERWFERAVKRGIKPDSAMFGIQLQKSDTPPY